MKVYWRYIIYHILRERRQVDLLVPRGRSLNHMHSSGTVLGLEPQLLPMTYQQ